MCGCRRFVCCWCQRLCVSKVYVVLEACRCVWVLRFLGGVLVGVESL